MNYLTQQNTVKILISSLTHLLSLGILTHFSHVQLFGTVWIVACQAPLPMGFPRQEY